MPWFSLLLAVAPEALPCAGLVHEIGSLAESDSQEVILWQDGGESVVEYRVGYQGDASAFGWVIVVPAGFSSLSDGDPGRFDALRSETRPQVWIHGAATGGGIACGCMGTAKGDQAGGGGIDTGGGFDIVSEGFTGTYAYTAFSADDVQGLAAALDRFGWPAGRAQASLETYAAEGGVDFVLVEVRPDVAETEGLRGLPPVVIRSTAERLFFPSRMARGAAADEMRTVVWVLGEERARVSGWTMVDVAGIEARGGETAEDAWDASLRAASASRPAYGRTWSGPWEGRWATRFETLTSTEMHMLDADFHPDDGRVDQQARVEVWLAALDTGAAAILLPLLGVGVVARRRS